MHETGIEPYYVMKDGKKLRFGYTTGTCASAAAKAATMMLLTGKTPESVKLMTPKGIELDLEVLEPEYKDGAASCAIRKFSGDDPDVTDGVLVYAEAKLRAEPGVGVDGGVGVGRVTKPGLKQPIGAAAINPVPMEMIRRAAEEAMDDCGATVGIDITISIPAGVELAQKTFNPRLGIVGGISVLGTSGIVEPMSEEALLASIELEVRQKRALGTKRVIITPGNYGADFANAVCAIPESDLVKCSNFVGKVVDMAANEGFEEVLLIGHIGKLIKVSGGVMNTHSREADCRAELMAVAAIRAGADAALAKQILECVTTDEMLRVINEAGLLEKTMAAVEEKIDFYLKNRVREKCVIGAIVFSEDYGTLCTTGPARAWLEEMRKREKSE